LTEIDTPETWGTASRFRRLARVDADTASYWLRTVGRRAHHFGHPNLNIDRCPGCAFEDSAKAEAAR
jgi:hypothetical protein